MNEFEKHKDNLDVVDKYNLKNIVANKSVIYSGDAKVVTKQRNGEESRQIRPLAAAVIGLDNTAAPLPEKTEFYDPWTDVDAQEIYLSSKPTCYLILSKPGSGAYSLGEAISKKLNCVHLCPKNIITDEIEQNTSTGICLDYNMKNNKVCAFDNILRVFKVKLNSLAVKHRGYVISGFPLVTANRSPKYLVKNLNGEEAILAVQDLMFDVICNLKKKKPKKPRNKTGSPHSSITSEQAPGEEEAEEEQEPEEELPEEEEEIKCELPKFLLDSCSDIILPGIPYYETKKAVLLEQLNTIFNLEMKPEIIIHLTCPDKDLVTKKSHKYMNYKNNMNTVEPFTAKVTTIVRWPNKYVLSDYTSPYDSHSFNPKYSCRQPINFENNSIKQMCNYKLDILPYIENKLKDYEPKNIIKLDARQTVHQMMHHITERLLLMPIRTVLIPEPLYMEEPPEDMEEFWKSVEELNVLRSGVLSFKRYPSKWFNRCPVELKKRQSTIGNPKFAVTFAKHVYLLSTLDSMVSFCRNPRPYLKLKYLEPTCRVIVMGTKSSGKTMISECLSWLFDTPIIDYDKFLEGEKQKKYDTFAKTILSEIIATLEDARFAAWQEAEMDRFAKLDAWCTQTESALRDYIPLLIESFRYIRKEKIEETLEEEEETKPEEPPTPSFEFLNTFSIFRNNLSFLPFLDDVHACEQALQGRYVAQHAPESLGKPIVKPAIPVLGDEDVMAAIAAYIIANELQKEIEPTIEELMNEIIRILTTIDTECQTATEFDQMYGKFIIDGFPSDPEYWAFLSEFKLMPDYTVALIENREVETDLIEQYKIIISSQKNHTDRFMQASDTLLKTKLQTKKPPNTASLDVKIIVNDIISASIDFNVPEEGVANPEDNPDANLATSFTESVEKFKEEWDSIKLKVEEFNKCYIDVELENKSDVQVVDEMLLKLRKCYMVACETNEDEEADDQDDEDEIPKDIMTFNNPRNLCETNIYCPIAYYDHGVLWEGKPEFSIKHDNKCHVFCKEEASELFQKDVSKYQSYNKPYKKIPPFRICVIGCIGSGKTTLSKLLAKELGIVHIDFEDVINNFLLPKHFKKVGRRYENSFTDVPIDDEAVVEFQMDEENENLISDILSNETELRRLLYNYFERGAPILSPLMERLIRKLWFQDPFVNTGFILDGYPRLPTDIEDMANCFCIPDLVIEMEGSSEITLQRLSPIMFKTWKVQLSEAKERTRQKLDQERKEWMHFITKNIVVKLIVDEILENMFFSTVEPIKGLSNESVIIDAHPSGSSNVDANLFSSYNEMIIDFPEPVDQSEWEKPDEVRERIDARIESIYETDDENIQGLKDLLLEQRIKTVSIKGSKPLDKVIRIALSKLSNLRNRCESLFEQTLIVNTDIAELLLLEGFCLISKFNRICPVYVYDNPDAIQSVYKLSRRKGKIYPIVHRSYIYFMGGPGAVKKFRTNPLKYISNNNIILFKEYPLRICVIGPPKSGRSSLAAKLAKRYGLICISRGMAIRNVLGNLYWTELGTKMQAAISNGECINEDDIVKAIQTAAIDHRTITYGFVLDGFPETASEAMELCKDGLYPNIVFDIRANVETVLNSSQIEVYYDILKYKPPYSRPFIENRYEKWSDKSYKIRDWINNDYQNLYVLGGNESKWQCLEDAVKVISEFIPKVHYYLTNVNTSIVPAHVMCISNKIFQERMSCYKNMCPVCLSKDILKHSGCPVDRKGIVQYQNKFYWICSDHLSKVLKHPHCYLSAQKVVIPEIPAIVKTVSMDLVYENGICIVNYAENLPAQKIVRGSSKHAASFQGKTYLFCGGKCLAKFLAKPRMYSDITVFKETKLFPPLSLNQLPNLGYLEQTVGNLITDACCSVNVFRPKYPGLSFKLSALLQIALYLKTHNPRIEKSILPEYLKASSVYDARCKLILQVGLLLRSMDNPFAMYPVCCKDPKTCDSGTVRKPSSYSTSSTKASVTIYELNK